MIPARPRRSLGRAAACTSLALAATAVPTVGDDVTGSVELQTVDAESSERIPGIASTDTNTEAVNRRLYLNLNRQVSPWVRFWAGGTFDDADVALDFDGGDSDTDEQRLRPYVGLGRETPRWLAQLSWTRDQRETETAGLPDRTSIRDGYFGTLAFAPPEAYQPRARLSLARAYDHDEDREMRDLVSDLADLSVTQQVNPVLRWTYRGTLTAREDRLQETEATTTGHRAEIAYTDQWAANRVLFHAQYAINRTDTEIRSRAGGSVDVPLLPQDGLVDRDDTPLDGTLASSPVLIDDDFVTPSVVDLGLPPPGGDVRPWALGLDFGLVTAVDTLFVWIDRDLVPHVAATLSWQVWTSPNNQDWTPREIVAPATYDEFLRRFELRFSEQSSRFVKLVVRPLDSSVPDADDYPTLLVVELDAVDQVPAPTGRTESDDTLQTLNVDARARLLANHDVFYFGNLNVIDPQDASADFRMSNGLSWLAPLAPQAAVTTRAVWEESREQDRRDRALAWSSALEVHPVERLQYTLALSGRQEQNADDSGGDQVSLLFYGVATLLDGLDLQLGVSRSHRENAFGQTLPSTQIDFSARIEPRSDLLVQLVYTDAESEARVGDGFEDLFTRAGEANVTWTPVPTAYVFGAWRVEWRSDLARDTIWRSTLSWTPFPQAAFRLGLSFDETRRELRDERQRSYGPTLRWRINPRSWVEVSWFEALDEQQLLRFENRVASAILRWGF